MKPLEAVQFRELWKVMDDLQTGIITLDQAIDAVRITVPGIPVTGTTKGDIVVWDGLGWVLLAAGADRDIIGADSTSASGIAYYSPSDVVAQGLAVTDTDTVDLTVAVSTLSADVITQMSVTSDVNGVKLVNDEAAPGNTEYYGTDGAGVKGYFPFPSALPPDGDYGDITVSGSGATWTIDNDVVTFAKMQNITSDRLLGRDTAGSGDTEEISVGGGVEFTGTGAIQRSALTGDVTAAAGSNATTIANDAVTFAKMQDISTDRLLGRDTAASGNVEEISLDSSTLAFTGSTSIKVVKEVFHISAQFGWNPVDATTVYFSGAGSVAQSANVLGKRIIPKAGTLMEVDIMWGATSVAGSNENISLYVRVNDTTDYLVLTIGDTNADKRFVNTAMNGGSGIAFNGTTDFYMMKCICPTWGTNPTAVQWQGTITSILT